MKKSLILMLIMVAVLSLGSIAFGESSPIDPEVLALVQADVDETNAIIDGKINEAVVTSIDIVNTYNDDVALAYSDLTGGDLKERLESLYEKKEDLIEDLINDLLDETNDIAQSMFDRAADWGVQVLCELVPVEIDGRIVMVDPLKVVGD